jgi:tight adherence protein B
LVVVGVAGPAIAQSAGTLDLRIEEMDTAGYPDVTMIVSVPPEMVGKSLTSDNFTVTEAGQENPVTATPVPTDGLQVVLLLDASGSMGGRPIVAAKDAAQEFLNAMPEGVEVAVVSFANEPELLSPFTTDVEQTASAITDLRLGKNTALYDGLVAGAELFDGAEGTRRTLVLLSDGGDTASATTLEEAIVSLLNAEVGFYAVELQSPESDAEALVRLGAATDGIVVGAADPDGLSSVFLGVASQIVNRYELHYTSEAFGRTAVGVKAEIDGVVATGSQAVRYPDPPPVAATPSEPAPEAAVVDVVAPTLRSGSVVVINWLQTPVAFWIGTITVFLSLLALLIFTGVGQPKARRIVPSDANHRFGQSKGKTLSSLAEQATLFAERTVNRGDATAGPITTLLERAGVQLRPGEFIVLSIAGALAVMAMTMFLAGPLLGLVLGALTLLVIRLWVGGRATKRQEAFSDQLTDVLQLMAGSIRSGFGLSQAMDTVATEIPAPAGEEFQRVKIEIQLGREVDDALLAMAARVGSEDFRWVVEAIAIHREVGGDLANILDSVMETVSDRIRIRRRAHALAAEGRISGLVLSLLPIGMAVFLFFINPEYMSELFLTQVGRLLIAIGLILMGIGALWMRRITSFKF